MVGDWKTSAVLGPFIGKGYRHDGDAGKGEKTAVFRAELKPGRYEVRIAYSPAGNRAERVRVVIKHADGEVEETMNQKEAPGAGSPFVTVGGVYKFDGDSRVVIGNRHTKGHVVIDAVQFRPAP